MTQTKDFAERLALTAGDKLIGLRGTGAGSESLFDVSLFDTATPLNGTRLGSYVASRSFEDKLFVFCGDSTTRSMNQTRAFFDRMKFHSVHPRSAFYGAAGFINYGMDGYTLDAFVNTSDDPDFVGATADNPNWNYAGSSQTGTATNVPMRDAVKTPGDVYCLCFGVNDVGLLAIGLEDEETIIDYISTRLATAIEFFQAQRPSAIVVLRIPTKMAARPVLNNLWPRPETFTDWGDNQANDEALIAKWNSALATAYRQTAWQYQTVVLFDTHKEISFASSEVLVDGLMLDNVHLTTPAYQAMAEGFVALMAGYPNSLGRRIAADGVYSSLSMSNPWEASNTYFRGHPEFEPLGTFPITEAGSTYIVVEKPYATIDKLLGSVATLYIEREGVAGFSGTFTFQAHSSNTLFNITVPAAAQAVPNYDRGDRVTLYYRKDGSRELPFFRTNGNSDYTCRSCNSVVEYTSALTADRTVTLGSCGSVRVVRASAATGAFNLLVKNAGGSTIATLAAAATYVDVCWNGTAWRVTGSGVVDDTP